MAELNIKLNASIVDKIETALGVAINEAITNTTVRGMSTVLQYAYQDDSNNGLSREASLEKLDTLLETKDVYDIMVDFMEAASKGGFLPRKMNFKEIRENKAQAEKDNFASLDGLMANVQQQARS